MLLRTVTSLMALAVLLASFWAGLPWVFLLVFIGVSLGIREFYRLHPPIQPLPSAPAPPATATAAVETSAEYDPGQATDPTSPSPETTSGDEITESPDGSTSPAARPEPEASRGNPQETASPFAREVTSGSQFPASGTTPLPLLLGAFWVTAFIIGGAWAEGTLQFWAVSLGVFLVGAFLGILWQVAFYHGPRWNMATLYLLLGPLYVGFLLAHVMLLARVGGQFFESNPLAFDPDLGPTIYEVGRNWLVFALLANVATDSGAYLVGRAIGRRPLAPVTSPGKTWEGAAGGFVCATVAAILLDRLLNLGLGPTVWDGAWASWNWQPVVIGATVGVVSQLGDLFESRLKRLSGVKDSGYVLPGHGGALDRLDSLLFTYPTVYYLLVVLVRP